MGNSCSALCEMEAKTFQERKCRVHSIESFLKQRTITELVSYLPLIRKFLKEISLWLRDAQRTDNIYGTQTSRLRNEIYDEACPDESIYRHICTCQTCMDKKELLSTITLTRTYVSKSLDILHEWKINLTLLCRRLEKELPAVVNRS